MIRSHAFALAIGMLLLSAVALGQPEPGGQAWTIYVANDDIAVTVVPLDAFALRLDLAAPAFEILRNDQNYGEVTKDQHGVTDFRFRYSIRAHAHSLVSSDAARFSRASATPLLHRMGRLPRQGNPLPKITVDSDCVIATCLKPADDQAVGGHILRLWEISGRSGPATIAMIGHVGTRSDKTCRQGDNCFNDARLAAHDPSALEIQNEPVPITFRDNAARPQQHRSALRDRYGT